MIITMEISMYPLNQAYEKYILEFIERLNTHSKIKVKTNATATHLLGEFDDVLKAFNQELKTSFETGEKFVVVSKFINSALTI